MQPKEERRLVVILFADISGFTNLSSTLDPEDVSEVANFYFNTLDSIIIKHGGMIDKHEGDLVMALFGVPQAHEDDPERAVKASIEMIDAIPEINKKLKDNIGRELELSLHIGINMGEVVFGRVGSSHKSEYTVMGDAVNLASRLCSSAKRGEIIVSDQVFRLSHYLFDYEIMEPIMVKGISEPVKVFKPLKLKDKPEPKRGIPGIYSPFVGRDKELNFLKELIKSKDTVILISGDAGIGKTRLAQELKGYTQGIGMVWLEGRCVSYGEELSYLPFKEIIKEIYGIEDKDSPAEVSVKLQKGGILSPDNVYEVLPYIANLFSIKLMDEKVKYLEPQELRLQTFLAIRLLLTQVSKLQDTVFVIDDYHWIDDTSIELINFILNKTVPFLLIILSRPITEKIQKLKVKSDKLKELNLSPLDKASSNTLIDNLLKISGISEELKNNILSKSMGNPFYLEEILKSLMYKGDLVFQQGMWKSKEVVQINIPPTIQGVIASRIDRLPSEDKEVLQVASVIGKDFYKNVLEYIYSDNLSLRLLNLEELDFIYRDNNKYLFKHPLIHEVAYNMLLKKRRQELHSKVGKAMEELFNDRLPEFYDLLSYHYYIAQEWRKSYEYSVKAAENAQKLYRNAEAIKLWDRAVDSLKFDIPLEELKKNEIDALTKKSKILAFVGEMSKSIELLNKALLLSREINDKEREVNCLIRMSERYILYSEYGEAEANLRYVTEILPLLNNKHLEVEYYTILGNLYLYQEKYSDALNYFSLALKTGRCLKDKHCEAKSLNNIGSVYYIAGEYDKASRYWSSALKIYKEIEDKMGEGVATRNIGMAYVTIGNYRNGVENFESSLRIRITIGDKRGEAFTLISLIDTYTILGEYNKALELVHLVSKINDEIGNKFLKMWELINIGNIYYYIGKLSDAITHYNSALEIATEIKKENEQSSILLLLADAYIEVGNSAAYSLLTQATEIIQRLGLKDDLLHIELGFVRLYLAQNNLIEAETHLNNARELALKINAKPINAELILHCGRLDLAKNNLEEASKNLATAIKLFKELNRPFELAKSYYYFGNLFKTLGDNDKSYYYLYRSCSIFKKLGADYWANKVYST